MRFALAIGLVALGACAFGKSNLEMGHPPLAPSYLKDLPGEMRNGLAVNYTQADVGVINVPNLLVSANGKRIENSDDWLGTRRPEIRQLLIDNQYGVSPSVASTRKATIRHDYSEHGVAALNGTALRSQSTITATTDLGSHAIDVLLYTPARAAGPSPTVLMVNFSPNVIMVDDTGIKETDGWDNGKRIPGRQARVIAKPDVAAYLARGYAVALVHYAQIEPDFDGGSALGLRKIYGPVNEISRNFLQVARRRGRFRFTKCGSGHGQRYVQLLARAGYAHVEQSALFGHTARGDKAHAVRQQTLFDSGQEHCLIFQTLGSVQGHQ